jgi:hypothetical protein
LKTEIDVENKEFVIHVPFAPEDLPYYPVLVAALVAGRSSTSMYNAMSRNIHGVAEDAVELEGVAHVAHASLVSYLRIRDASAEEVLARKKATLEKIARRATRPRRRPDKPIPVTASPTAQQLLDGGSLDFLDELASREDAEDGH